jgi:hypothetical protein
MALKITHKTSENSISVKNGRYTSCGCLSKNRWNMVGDKNPAFKGKGQIRAYHLSCIRRSAKRRKLEFEMDLNFLWNLYERQKGKCPLTGLDLCFGRVGRKDETTASLDRIDNDLGYTKDNVRWIFKDANMLRRNLDNDYFIYLCHLVAKNTTMPTMNKSLHQNPSTTH